VLQVNQGSHLHNNGAVQLVADLNTVAVDHVPDDAPRPKAAAPTVDHDSDEPEIILWSNKTHKPILSN
jgi:hypothetical protein